MDYLIVNKSLKMSEKAFINVNLGENGQSRNDKKYSTIYSAGV